MNCVLFDLDGTIADTEVLKAKALALSVQEFCGKAHLDLYKGVMGQSWEVVTSAFFEVAGLNISHAEFNLDAYLIALKKLGVDSRKTVVFEDSESGFKAAHAASLTVFGVRHSFNETHDFSLCARTLTEFRDCLTWEIFEHSF